MTSLAINSATTATFLGAAYVFNLNQFINSAATFYEMYRIAGIRIRITPRFSDYSIFANTVNTNTNALPMIYTRFDPDDIVTPTSLAEFLESNNYQSYRGNKIRTFYYKPTYMVSANVVGAPTPSLMHRGGYLSTRYPDVNHNGFKIALTTPAGSLAQQFTYDIEVRAYIMLKGAV